MINDVIYKNHCAMSEPCAMSEACAMDPPCAIFLFSRECTVNAQAIYGLLRAMRLEYKAGAGSWHAVLEASMSAVGLKKDSDVFFFDILEHMPEKKRKQAFEDCRTVTVVVGEAPRSDGKEPSCSHILDFQCDAELGVIYLLLCEFRTYLRRAYPTQWVEKFAKHLAQVNMPNAELTFFLLNGMPADVRSQAFEKCLTVSARMQ